MARTLNRAAPDVSSKASAWRPFVSGNTSSASSQNFALLHGFSLPHSELPSPP